MSILHSYTNGNCEVTLHADGSKVREWPDGETPKPESPESIDLKITNQCDVGCAWCHEASVKDGLHGSLARVMKAVEGLPPGVEIAIGGGDPLSHPLLVELLRGMQDRGLVANMTLRADMRFAITNKATMIASLQAAGLLRGIGLSGVDACLFAMNNDALPSNTVCHAVAGIDDPLATSFLRSRGLNVLILGYKKYGRGAEFWGAKIEANLSRWRFFTQSLLNQTGGVLSFDNLALEQLDIRRRIPEDVWAKHYMGDDGAFTMYFDAVKNQYAASSTSERHDAGEMTLIQAYQEARNV